LGINAAASGAMAILSGGITLFLAGSIGSSLGFLGPVGIGILAATGGGLGSAAGLFGFRAIYRNGHARATRALDALLAAVAAKAEGGWGFASGNPGGSPPPG
jgi:hypothetical protein